MSVQSRSLQTFLGRHGHSIWKFVGLVEGGGLGHTLGNRRHGRVSGQHDRI
jgi:hypothetical protein